MSRLILVRDFPADFDAVLNGLTGTFLSTATDNQVVISGRLFGGSPAELIVGGGGLRGGAGLLDGSGFVDTVVLRANGRAIFTLTEALITGGNLAAWLQGDGDAFNRALTAGNDFFSLSDLSEAQDGGLGDDTLFGFGGNDTLHGDQQRDYLDGGDGSDWLVGGESDDLLNGGIGDDAIDGGTGLDIWVSGALRRQVELPAGGTGIVRGTEGNDVVSGIETFRFRDGSVAFSADSRAAQVERLYAVALGRDADAIGLANWVAALEGGAFSLDRMAEAFVASAEFAVRFPAFGNADLVELLYGNALARTPDPGGLAAWTGVLDRGEASRGQVVAGFSESAEFRARQGLDDGIWVPDLDAVAIFRLYQTVLDRLPDADGLAGWTAALEAGFGLRDIVAGFTGSAEFIGRFGPAGTIPDAEFVRRVYEFALDRSPDPAGLAGWTALLETGAAQRPDILLGFAFSDEVTSRIADAVADGILFA